MKLKATILTTHTPRVPPFAHDDYFRVQVLPAALPDAEITWTNRDGHVAFVGGCTGRDVHVRGVSAGDAQLEVLIDGRERHAPTFPLKVVDPQAFKITAWIISGKNDALPWRVEDVQAMIAPLNDIYRQVGVSFYLDTITVTNIPDAYNLPYDSTTNNLWGHDTERIWYVGPAPVGFFDNEDKHPVPIHQ